MNYRVARLTHLVEKSTVFAERAPVQVVRFAPKDGDADFLARAELRARRGFDRGENAGIMKRVLHVLQPRLRERNRDGGSALENSPLGMRSGFRWACDIRDLDRESWCWRHCVCRSG